MALLLCHDGSFGATFLGLKNRVKLNLSLFLQGFNVVSEMTAL
jgi:hypothetical protein